MSNRKELKQRSLRHRITLGPSKKKGGGQRYMVELLKVMTDNKLETKEELKICFVKEDNEFFLEFGAE